MVWSVQLPFVKRQIFTSCGCVVNSCTLYKDILKHLFPHIINKTWRREMYRNWSNLGTQYSFLEIDHEIFSTVMLSLLLIQEGLLTVSGERMCSVLVNCLEDKACPVNVWLGKLTVLDMIPLGWLGHKTSTQTKQIINLITAYAASGEKILLK